MNVKKTLSVWVDGLTNQFSDVLWQMPSELWYWSPPFYRYSIALNVWHVLRDLDVLTTQVLQNKMPAEEIWCRHFPDYTPHGKGYKGLGTLVLYSEKEMEEMPAFSPQQLHTYLQTIHTDLNQWLTHTPPLALHQNKTFLGSRAYPTHIWVYNKLNHAKGHLGEIAGIKNLWQKQTNNKS